LSLKNNLFSEKPNFSFSGFEMLHALLYLCAWLFPVIASFIVALTGNTFSFVSLERQLHYLDVIGLGILIALLGGVAAFIFTILLLGFFNKTQKFSYLNKKLCFEQLIFLIALALISGFGLFKSFGMTIFEGPYMGPSEAWLNYGAWGVTYVFLTFILICHFLLCRVTTIVLFIVVTVIFLPFLICGSRIDYLSTMLGLAAYSLFYSLGGVFSRLLKTFSIITLSFAVATIIGNLRYDVNIDKASNFILFNNLNNSSDEAMHVPVPEILGFVSERKPSKPTVYLGTFGDIGSSYFQTVSLITEDNYNLPRASVQIKHYFERLLPGSFFKNRPIDVATLAPEVLGGGALHALGEGYAIKRFLGCCLMGGFFGSLIAFSIYFGRLLTAEYSPVLVTIVLFPWIILIRGGWYQFFAVLKSLEILIFILILLAFISRWRRWER